MNIAIVYFSATRQTEKVANVIKQAFKDKGVDVDMVDITCHGDRKAPLDLTPYDAMVIGAPIHSCRAPRVVREWLATLEGQGKKAAMFFTYGAMLVHPTHYSTREILKAQGFTVVSSAEFLAAHTFNKGGWQAVPLRPDETDYAVAREYVNKTYARFTGEDPDILGDLEKTDRTEEELDAMEALRFKAMTQIPTRDGDDCSMCMECQEKCPTGAMDAESGNANQDLCIACLRCMDVCPEDALKINDMSPSFAMRLEMAKATPEDLAKKQSKTYL